MCWLKWEEICKKKEGGLGFRDLEVFNFSLLAKQGWHILKQLDSVVARMLKAKYFLRSSFLECSLESKVSYT